MVMRLLALVSLGCFLSCSAATAVDNSMFEDDEDITLIAEFTLRFRISSNCNIWYSANVVPFSDVFRQTIIDNINEDCNNCNFTIANFANEFSTCGGGQSAIFSARIANWDSSHYPATFLLDQIQSRYTNRTSQIILSTSQFVPGSFNETELTLVVTDVQVRQTVLGSGDGTTDGIDVAVTDATTDNGSFIVFDGGEKLRATFAMTLGIGIMVSVHQAVGY